MNIIVLFTDKHYDLYSDEDTFFADCAKTVGQEMIFLNSLNREQKSILNTALKILS